MTRKRGVHPAELCRAYLTRFGRIGAPADLARAIQAGREAIRTGAPGPRLAGSLNDLSIAVRLRGEMTRSAADLDEAIDLAESALRVAGPGGQERLSYRNTLGNAHMARFELTSDAEDVAAGIAHLRAAAAEIPTVNNPHQSRMYSNLASALMTWSTLTGTLDGLNEAADAARAAVAAAEPGSAEQARCLSNLGGVLKARFVQVGETADLNEAVEAVRTALAAGAPPTERAAYALNLSSLLADRFARAKVLADLDQAAAAASAAAAMMPSGHRRQTGCQAALSAIRWQLFRERHDLADLDGAVEAGRAAVRGAPAGHPERADTLHNLTNALLSRASLGPPRQADLDEIVRTGQAAVVAAPAGHPHLVGYLLNLGAGLEARFELTGNRRDLTQAMACWRQAVATGAGSAAERLNAARLWGRSAAMHGLAADAEAGFAEAVTLLPLQAWPGLQRQTREQVLSSRAGLAGDAAACAISNGHAERAVELLELGRTVLWSQLLQLRDDLDDLRRDHPDAARRLDAIRGILDQPDRPAAVHPAGSTAPRPVHGGRPEHEARIRAAHEWEQALADIRALPGFESFLRPPRLAELTRHLGRRTVVIINVSRYRCDALAVSSAGVELIPLPMLTFDAAARQAARCQAVLDEPDPAPPAAAGRTPAAPADIPPQPPVVEPMTEVLAWLWDTVTGPVLDALGRTSRPVAALESWPRLWWCPTGPLSSLPLHAAGHHQPGENSRTVPDRVVSSYLPSLRTLYRADQRDPGQHAQPGRPEPSLLLVTMPTTPYLPDESPLPSVRKEAASIVRHFPLAVMHLDGAGATRRSVLRALPDHAYAHFACHGIIDQAEPAGSGLYLSDGLLTISALASPSLPASAAQLAFLSACHSQSPGQDLPDEALTMAAAVQMAGFRHVIASMWAVCDPLAPKLADRVYRRLALARPPGSDTSLPVACALHAAISSLRASGYPASHWAAYLHTGP